MESEGAVEAGASAIRSCVVVGAVVATTVAATIPAAIVTAAVISAATVIWILRVLGVTGILTGIPRILTGITGG